MPGTRCLEREDAMMVEFRIEQADRRHGDVEDQGLTLDRRVVIQAPGDRGTDLESMDAVGFPDHLDQRPIESEDLAFTRRDGREFLGAEIRQGIQDFVIEATSARASTGESIRHRFGPPELSGSSTSVRVPRLIVSL